LIDVQNADGGDDPARGDQSARQVGEAARVREVFETMPVALAALEGPDNRFVAANAAYREFLGRAGFIGRPLREVVPDMAGQQLLEVVERVYATGLAETGREWRVQRVLDDTGTAREAFVNVALSPRFGPDGAIVGVNASVFDVTAEVLARRAAQARTTAVERRYARARDLIDAMQRELLPPGLPVLPGARIAASYLLAGDGGDVDTAAGGDWFDAVPRPGGRVALAVGDVVGHGIAASAAMGQLRAVLADRLDEGADLAAALGAADRLARRTPGARAATVCVAELDPADGSVTYCTAGHPPPLLVPARGDARYLPVTGAGPLGTGRQGAVVQFSVGVAHLDVDDVLLLYSDGIVERPGRSPAAATVELTQVAADTVAGRSLDTGETSPVERICTQTLELLVRTTGYTDDITLLAAQRIAAVPPLELTAPAATETIPVVRTAIQGWLAAIDVADDDTFALQHAIGELVTNAVEHAYAVAPREPSGSGGRVGVRLALTEAGTVRATVFDHGRWYDAAPDPHRGRGLAISRDLVDDLDVEQSADGTTATVTHRLARPARLLTSEEIVSGIAATPRLEGREQLLILDQSGRADLGGEPSVRVEGPLDAVTAPQLYHELQRRTRGGTRSLTVDLGGVTHLASAAVSILHEAVDTSAGAELVLYAPPGSVAQHVLALVALPHTMRDPAATDDLSAGSGT
jgi:PAS domain S-box-containing protein